MAQFKIKKWLSIQKTTKNAELRVCKLFIKVFLRVLMSWLEYLTESGNPVSEGFVLETLPQNDELDRHCLSNTQYTPKG